MLSVEKVAIPLPQIGSALDGLRIVLMSDFHLYPYTRIEHIRRAVSTANSLRPDLILLGGDFVLSKVDSIFELAPALARLNARHGIFCVLGNHDYWRGADTVVRGLKDSGLPVLRNTGVELQMGRDSLYLAGVDDGWVKRHDLSLSLEHKRAGVPAIVLMHEPDFADDFSKDDRICLQLSGHSHGGQVRFPLIGSPFCPPFGRKYDRGLYRTRNLWHYTTVGIGVTVPIRFNCPPEVTEITLTRDS